MHTGRAQSPGLDYPHLGSVMAKLLGSDDDPLPGYIHITPGGGRVGGSEAAFLGPKYGALYLGNGSAPANTDASRLRQPGRRPRSQRLPLPAQRPLRRASPDGRDGGLHHDV